MLSLMVVDDEQYAVDGISLSIDWAEIGIKKILTANSAEEARENIIKNGGVSVIVCDIEMADESGLDLIRWLRNQKYTSKVIFLTAHAQFEYAQQAVGLGAVDYLLKPVDHRKLKKIVENSLQDLLREDKKEEIFEISENPLIVEIKTYIQNNLSEGLSREVIAQNIGVHPVYLSRFFREQTGEKLSAYILRKQMERAKKMLMETNDKISYIASSIGYSSDSYFIKAFREQEGMTPHEYRKNSRKGVRE